MFRVATAPCLHGEIVVLRVLDRGSVAFDYATQGHAPQVISRLNDALASPNGILLVTGPTGSGKTTTLYTALLGLNAVQRKIHHRRRPDRIPAARHQPDPGETADRPRFRQPAAQHRPAGPGRDHDRRNPRSGNRRNRRPRRADRPSGALHLAHHSAAAAITRLRDMGLEDYLVAAVLRGVLAQRLVRRLCPACKRPGPAPPELRRRFGLNGDTIHHATAAPPAATPAIAAARRSRNF